MEGLAGLKSIIFSLPDGVPLWLLYYYNQLFRILEKMYSERAEKIFFWFKANKNFKNVFFSEVSRLD